MKLRDPMDDAVGDATADLGRLAYDSRRLGMQRRRYRQALSGVGVAATAAVIFSAVHLASSGSVAGTGAVAGDTSAVATPTPSTDPSPTLVAELVPLTGRGTVAALRAAIEEQAQGTYSGFAGQGGQLHKGPHFRATYGEVEFTPVDGTGVGVVGINVQDGSILDGMALDCTGASMVECQVKTLPNGDRVRTYLEQPVRTAEGDGLRRVAELVTSDRSLRVVVSATNGFELASSQWDITRPQPVLTSAQLSQIVSQPWWGFKIPREYETAGQELTPYTDLDAITAIETPSLAPSPG